MKILGTTRDSKCMYCDSTSYGKGCPYGPDGKHVHSDDPKRCVWCGSTSVGKGCPYNPFSKIHQKGIAFNPIMMEAFENGVIQGLVMKRLSQDVTDMPAYKAGLIDESGNVIKEPKTIEERKLLTGVDKYLIKVRNLFKEKIELLNTTLYYEKYEDETVEELSRTYPAELELKDELHECMTHLLNLVAEYNTKGLSSSKIEKLILEAMLNAKEI